MRQQRDLNATLDSTERVNGSLELRGRLWSLDAYMEPGEAFSLPDSASLIYCEKL